MRKRMLSLLLVAVFLCTLLPQFLSPVSAASSGSCGANLSWSFNPGTGALTITGRGDMTISGIDAPWSTYAASIKSVSLPNGLTSISRYAFYKCSKLTTITFPSTLTQIGDSAFAYCTALKSLNLPDGINEISESAFSYCSSLTEVKLPAKLSTITSLCFAHCSKLQTITLPNQLTTIESMAFFNCSALKKISFPASLSAIESYAFQACSKLTEVIFSDGLSTIEKGAFLGCTDLKRVTIPKSVTTIEDGALGWESESRRLSGFTICGYSGTVAQSYAKKYNFKFIDLSITPSEPTEPSTPTEPTEPSTPTEPTEPSTPTEPTEPSTPTEPTEPSTPTEPTEPSTPTEPTNPPKNPFVDVRTKDFFYQPVLWAVYHNPQITTGKDATHFAPKDNCTRGQVVTFLWRAYGEQQPKSSKNPFVDAKAGKYYYNAMLWAVENNVTAGVDATHFQPNGDCTRGQVVTFLWRAAGSPEPKSGKNPFVDVKAGKFYYKAVLWAVENGITAGTDATHFQPNSICTRGQVVTFLYRQYAKQ